MEIEYDELKRALTLEHRGLDFANAATVFEGSVLSVDDDRRSYGEQRFQTIGRLGDRVVMIVWTPRTAARRIISMRDCNARERDAYERAVDRSGRGA